MTHRNPDVWYDLSSPAKTDLRHRDKRTMVLIKNIIRDYSVPVYMEPKEIFSVTEIRLHQSRDTV